MTSSSQDLRQKRRILSRIALVKLGNNPQQVQDDQTRSGSIIKPPTSSKSYFTSHRINSHSKSKAKGYPTGHDSQGRSLYTRQSDRKLVYLNCYVAGCPRTSFETVEALRRHVSHPLHHHKIVGEFTSNEHAIELCGEVAPGQEGFDTSEDVRSSGTMPQETARFGLLTQRPTHPDLHDSEIDVHFGEAPESTIQTGAILPTSSPAARAADLERAYRTSSMHKRKEAYLSSDSESDDREGRSLVPIALGQNDQHIARRGNAASQFTARMIKAETSPSTSYFNANLPTLPTWNSARFSPILMATEKTVNGEAIPAPYRKRATSVPPTSTLTMDKRPRFAVDCHSN